MLASALLLNSVVSFLLDIIVNLKLFNLNAQKSSLFLNSVIVFGYIILFHACFNVYFSSCWFHRLLCLSHL